MRPITRPPSQLTLQPFARADGLAVLSADVLEGPAFQRITRGAYWVAGQELTHGWRIQGIRAILPKQAVLVAVSAAWALGARWAGVDDPVEVALDPDRRVRGRAGLIVHGDRLPPEEIVRTRLGPATCPARTVFDLGRRGELGEAVAWVDAIMRACHLEPGDVEAVMSRHPGARGVRQLRRVLALADARAESLRESRLRVLLVQSGLPPVVPQYVVRNDTGRFVARLDLAWPTLKVAIEYDGDHHRTRSQHARDLQRHNRLRALGWTVIQVDAALLRDPQALLALVCRVLAGR